ncbi:MAG: hypothetical protein A2010_18600 [Nitrospirae bacterium GWD2_57_9]|nr:MAG: hypothetical protein A2010_18600 [Nitrospirae bacterium GWD2_57_9]OGW45484.1 MAG: hypothetical protein A2078_12550 [Nitrospirae bacterium GWC2_57_9]
MRLDLFLKTSRLIKRRAMARELCDSGKVHVNGHEAKASKEIRPGDVMTVHFSSRVMELEIISVEAPVQRKAPHEWYRVRADSRIFKDQARWNEDH